MDLQLLGAAIPPAVPQAHYQRFERQLAGQGTFLIAWADTTPVGHAEIRWDGNDVGDPFSRCPQLADVFVWPETMRSRGIGTALIAEAEGQARRRGLSEIGLGVTDRNRRAATLCLRLGYQETGCRFFDHRQVRDGDQVRWVSEPCRFLVKLLG